jgi:hypothetical protein
MTRPRPDPSAEGHPGRVAGLTATYAPRLPGHGAAPELRDGKPRYDPAASPFAPPKPSSWTGGSTSNVNFRRMFDPRLTEVYQTAGEPYTFQDASGELAAMAIGASLWGLGNQILENGDGIRTQRALGAQYNYFAWDVNSPLLPLVRAAGLEVKDWQNLILVNQLGQRFYDETKGDYPNGNLYNEFNPYRPGDYRNNASIDYNPTHYNFFNAAVAMNAASAPPDYAAGPIWAIFDADAVAREQWHVTPPYVDPHGYYFSANTLAALAAAIDNPYQTHLMDGATLQATVERYNSFVDAGMDVDFGKPRPQYKIQRPPFYAAWAAARATALACISAGAG